MSLSQRFQVLKIIAKTSENLKYIFSFSLFRSLLSFLCLNAFSLLLIFSATAFSLLSLSFSFSLAAASFFFLYLLILSDRPRKKTILEMLFLFFLHFICSSSYVHHVWFVYRLQQSLIKTCISDFPLIYPFLLWMFNFLGLSS